MTKRKKVPAIKRAIKLAGGRQVDLAERLGISQSLVTHWLNSVKPVTAERAVQIEAITNGAVTRKELRPDLFL